MKKCSSALIMLSSFTFFLLSCSSHSKHNDEMFNILREGLDASADRINISSEQILHNLEEKLNDPSTKDKASIWFPKAKMISAYTKDMSAHLNKLKSQKNLSRDQAKELYNKLIQYKSKVLASDSSIKYAFEENFILISKAFEVTANKADNFYEIFFRNSSHEAFLALLGRLNINIKTIENKVILFCNQNIATHGHYYDIFATLVVQDKSIARPNEKITVSAGVGSFSLKVSPKVFIGKKEIKVDETTGQFTYEYRAPGQAGQYSTPVTITFTDQNGIINTVSKTINYTVAKECDQ